MTRDANRFIRNIVFWLASNFASRAVAAVLFIVLARTATVSQTGAYSLATTFLVLLVALTGWGFEHLLIRDVAQDRSSATTHLSRYLVWRVALAIAAYLVLILVVFAIGYAPETRTVILVTCLALVTEGINELLQAYLVAEQKTEYMLTASLPTNVLRLAAGLLAVPGGGPLALAALLVATSALKTVLLGRAVLGKMVAFQPQASLQFEGMGKWMAVAAPYLLIDVAWIVEHQSGIILLSVFADEEAVGLYSAAFALVSILLILSQAYMMSVFPIMSKLHVASQSRLEFVCARSVELMLVISLPIAVAVTIMSDEVIALIYPATYAQSSSTLAILVWTVVFAYMHAPISRLMIIHDTQDKLAMFIGLGAVAHVMLGLVLIPRYGVNGVAVARVASYLLFFSANFFYVNRNLIHLGLLRLIMRPSLAALVMAATLLATGSLNPILSTAAGATVFALTLWLTRFFSRQDILDFQRALEEARG